MESKGKESNRRSFIRKIVGAAALGGLAALLLGQKSEKASGATVTTNFTNAAGQIAFWDGASTIKGSNNLRWEEGNRNFIGGYSENAVEEPVIGATISGGGDSGAAHNVAGDYGTVGGGKHNTVAYGICATVGGGQDNGATADCTTVGGGYSNTAGNYFATVGGGSGNTASGSETTVGGGAVNTASNTFATVGGGYSHEASGYGATVPGGSNNVAAGDYSFAAGRRAKIGAAHSGAFLYADMSNYDFNSTAANEFAVRATGGARFVTAIDGSGNPTKTTVITSAGNLGIGTSAPLYGLDLRTPGSTAAQMHFASTNTDAGGYFVSASDANFFISGGSAYNGASWIAKASSAYEFGGGPAGVRFFFDSGLTPGLSFAPTTRLIINSSGNVGIGTETPHASALFDVTSTAKGFLPPRMTTAQRDAIASPAEGLIVYNMTTKKLNFHDGTAWRTVTST